MPPCSSTLPVIWLQGAAFVDMQSDIDITCIGSNIRPGACALAYSLSCNLLAVGSQVSILLESHHICCLLTTEFRRKMALTKVAR